MNRKEDALTELVELAIQGKLHNLMLEGTKDLDKLQEGVKYVLDLCTKAELISETENEH